MYIANLSEVVKDFEAYDKKVQERLQGIVIQSGEKLRSMQVKILKRKVKKWTGNLASSLNIKYSGRNLGVAVGPDNNKAKYAGYIEHGRPPFTIRPKNGEYLTFKIGVNWVKVKQVQHPGFAGYWYVRSSFNFVKPKFIKAVRKAIQP